MALEATTVLRLGGCLLLLALLVTTGSVTTGSRVGSRSAEQQELVDFGLNRFDAQDLVLPDVRFEFFSSVMRCGGHLGTYHRGTSTLTMCSLDKGTMLHELAHAWANITLTDQDREAFVDLRGLDSWNDHSQPWKERGTEQAAEVIAWGLLDETNAQLFLFEGRDGSPQPEFRLLAIDNSSVESLYEAFVLLTGMEPVFRSPSEWDSESLYVEWQARMSTTSPEARRSGRSGSHSRPTQPFSSIDSHKHGRVGQPLKARRPKETTRGDHTTKEQCPSNHDRRGSGGWSFDRLGHPA